MNGTDRTSPINTREPLEWHARTAPLSTYLHDRYSDQFWVRIRTSRTYFEMEVHVAAPVRSYCLTVQTDLIRPATLNGALPKPDGMQAVAFVPEMSHFHAQMGRIFADQLKHQQVVQVMIQLSLTLYLNIGLGITVFNAN